jgi:hypothetical protein
VHDLSDIPLDLAKVANYAKLCGRKGLFLCELAFVVNLVTWVGLRLYYLPFHITYQYMHVVRDLAGAAMSPPLPPPASALARLSEILTWAHLPPVAPFWGFNTCLLAFLQTLHFYWFYMLLRAARRLLRGDKTYHVANVEYEGGVTNEKVSGEGEGDDKKKA